MSSSILDLNAATTLTSGSTVTSFLALTTPGPSPVACSAQIYAQWDGTLMAFDPYYAVISPDAVSCFAPEVTKWWNQQPVATGKDVLTTVTALGPKFECPELYGTVATEKVGDSTTRVFCCPSGYSFKTKETVEGAIQPTQCASTITAGQQLAYDYNVDYTLLEEWKRTTGTVDVKTVNAIHVNGYIFGTPTSASSSTPINTAASASNTGDGNEAGEKENSGLPTGAIIGIAIGAVVLLIAAAIAAWFLWRRRNKRRKMGIDQGQLLPVVESIPMGGADQHHGVQEFYKPEVKYQDVPPPTEIDSERPPQELGGGGGAIGGASGMDKKHKSVERFEMP